MKTAERIERISKISVRSKTKKNAMHAKEPDSSSVKSARSRESLRGKSVKQERRPSLTTKGKSQRPSVKPKRIEDAREEKLAETEMPSAEANAERTELLAKPGDSKGERLGSQEERRSR